MNPEGARNAARMFTQTEPTFKPVQNNNFKKNVALSEFQIRYAESKKQLNGSGLEKARQSLPELSSEAINQEPKLPKIVEGDM